MNAMLIPILLICAAVVVVGFIVWMLFFNRSGEVAIREQHDEEHRHARDGRPR
jgi:hypothetical protein